MAPTPDDAEPLARRTRDALAAYERDLEGGALRAPLTLGERRLSRHAVAMAGLLDEWMARAGQQPHDAP